MRLSVIVPVYNMAAEGKLEYCLNSLVHQTLEAEEYEVIAVDDCSGDSSPEILRRFEKEYPSILKAILSPVNHRQGGAKNRGLLQAKGEWIAFIDADDWVTEDYFERLLQRAEVTGADMVGCDYSMTGEHSMRPGKVVPNHRPEQTGEMDHEKYRLLLLDSGSLCVKIYRREIIFGGSESRAVFPEDMFYEDNAVCKTWMLRSKHFEYIPEPLYFYYQHGDSTVHTISEQNMEDRRTAGRLMLAEAGEKGYLEEYRQEMEFAFTVLFYSNTLFSVMQARSGIRDPYGFTAELAKEMKETFPDFQNNPYYRQRISSEEKKLIAMQMDSQIRFYIYYRLLWGYRNLRKALKKKNGAI